MCASLPLEKNLADPTSLLRCGHCKKLAPAWTQLASYMRNRLTIAEVNCDEHSSLCKEQDVPGYPSLFFYTGGGNAMHKTDYTGGRKVEQLRQFAEMAVAPCVHDPHIVESSRVDDLYRMLVLYRTLTLETTSTGRRRRQCSICSSINPISNVRWYVFFIRPFSQGRTILT